MRSEEMRFIGGPMDGRVLPVMVGATGQPPKTYEIPVPGEDDRPAVVHVYRRVPASVSPRLGVVRGWAYEYEPEGKPRGGPKWPWSKPDPR
ncbi:hypothetical protein [Streptomyces sp. SAJ15]|uniref:hypothetical protein n=1 Tax=Streptomyces sp. SAJ15 TaxID=2011095 RepID=UPI0011848C59|nr:hypothetical protein [Streptomyces sp. SAJ15]TVL94115.1 hypothetical protein CD790_03700 [Streptomyces sp. SAJ15]